MQDCQTDLAEMVTISREQLRRFQRDTDRLDVMDRIWTASGSGETARATADEMLACARTDPYFDRNMAIASESASGKAARRPPERPAAGVLSSGGPVPTKPHAGR